MQDNDKLGRDYDNRRKGIFTYVVSAMVSLNENSKIQRVRREK